jgi:hypothetical protein
MSSVTTTGLSITASLAMIVAPWATVVDEPRVKPESAWTVFSDEALRAGLGTATGPIAAEQETASDLSTIVANLKAESGLTADQLGRLLGVSRRSIHNWAAGTVIAPAHEERLRDLERLVFSLPAHSPEERRRLLLESSNGPSIFRQFAAKADAPQRIKFGVPVEERLGL